MIGFPRIRIIDQDVYGTGVALRLHGKDGAFGKLTRPPDLFQFGIGQAGEFASMAEAVGVADGGRKNQDRIIGSAAEPDDYPTPPSRPSRHNPCHSPFASA